MSHDTWVGLTTAVTDSSPTVAVADSSCHWAGSTHNHVSMPTTVSFRYGGAVPMRGAGTCTSARAWSARVWGATTGTGTTSAGCPGWNTKPPERTQVTPSVVQYRT